jgi:hypothetical protein
MSRTDQIREVIAEQQGRGEMLEDFIRVRARDNPEEQIKEAIAFGREIIEAVPTILDRMREVANERGFRNRVEPMIAQAEDYFLDADDILPESQFGEFGLLDDAYVALKVVDLVHTKPPLLEVDLGGPIDFLRQVLGDDALAMLDAEVEKATARMQAHMDRIREAAQREAEAQRARQRQEHQDSVWPSAPSRPSPGADRQQCDACSGSGRVTCTSCYGAGSHTQSHSRVDWEGNVEYVTESIPCGCAGGYMICGSCGGAGWR